VVKNICKDINILSKKSEDASILDINICQDLKDTLLFNQERCVGMAANMIGINKNIIVFFDKDELLILINPKIIRHSKEYKILEEGCLSLEGIRKTKRYYSVTVEYLDIHFKKRISTFLDFTGQIVQHEIDHLNGIII